jgi:hypothetical protein
MLGPLTLDPRIAFLLLVGLILGAAIPLAMGWARLLPEERPPFEIDNPRRRSLAPIASIYANEPEPRRLDPGAIVLLVLLTVAFVLQFPGLPRGTGLNSGLDHFPTAEDWHQVALPALMFLTAGVAIIYGAVRRSLLRKQLVIAGCIVLALWILAPWLYRALAGM